MTTAYYADDAMRGEGPPLSRSSDTKVCFLFLFGTNLIGGRAPTAGRATCTRLHERMLIFFFIVEEAGNLKKTTKR